MSGVISRWRRTDADAEDDEERGAPEQRPRRALAAVAPRAGSGERSSGWSASCSSRPLVVAHHLHEPLLERLAPAAQLRRRRAPLLDQPARDLGQHVVAGRHACGSAPLARAGRSSVRTRARPSSDASVDRPGRRSRPRAAAAPRSSVSSRTTRPCLTNATRSQVASTSPSRCELRNTAVPRGAQLADDVAHEQPPERIEARRRLVEEHQFRVVDAAPARGRRAAACPCCSRAAAVGGVEHVDAGEQRLDARLERWPRSPYSRPWKRSSSRAGQPVVKAEVLGQESDLARAPPVAERRAQHGARAAVGATRPSSILSDVVLPAPFGPRKPNTSPAPTDSERSGDGQGRAEAFVQSRRSRLPRRSLAWSLPCQHLRPFLHC